MYVPKIRINPENDVKFNTKIKKYKDGSTQTVYCSDYIFKSRFDVDIKSEAIKESLSLHEHNKIVQSVEEFKQNSTSKSNTESILDYLHQKEKEENDTFPENFESDDSDPNFDSHSYVNGYRSDSIKRAKEKVFDIAIQNDFDYFFTLTISPESFDRTDVTEFRKRLRYWLNNMYKRHGFKYLLVPEFHHDGKALHAHGLCNKCGIEFVDSGKKTKKGIPIYNMSNWKYGFSTAIPLDVNKQAVSRYITKYITKDSNKIFGKFYWASNSLVRHVDTVYCNTDFDNLDLVQYGAFKYETDFKYTK